MRLRVTAPEEPGTYYYSVSVDKVNGEEDTSNNSGYFDPIKVTVKEQGPDLVVKPFEGSWLDTVAGSGLKIPEDLITDVAFTPNHTYFVLHPQFVPPPDANAKDFPFKYTITLSQENSEPLSDYFMFPLQPTIPVDAAKEFTEKISKVIFMELVGLTPYGKAIGYAKKLIPLLIGFVDTLEESIGYVPPGPQVTTVNYYSNDTDATEFNYPILFVIKKRLSSVKIQGIQEYYREGSWVPIQSKIESLGDDSNDPGWLKILQNATGWIVEDIANLITTATNFFNNEILGKTFNDPTDRVFRKYEVSWDLEEAFRQENPDSAAAPRAQPMSLADYPPFQRLSPEMREYLLQYFREFTNTEVAQDKVWQVPEQTSLLPNYPNPFNPETWIPYQLTNPANVRVTIYDINGHVVRDLDLGHQRAGMYHSRSRAAYWDGRNALGEPVASGVYFYTLTTGDFTATRKMLIRK